MLNLRQDRTRVTDSTWAASAMWKLKFTSWKENSNVKTVTKMKKVVQVNPEDLGAHLLQSMSRMVLFTLVKESLWGTRKFPTFSPTVIIRKDWLFSSCRAGAFIFELKSSEALLLDSIIISICKKWSPLPRKFLFGYSWKFWKKILPKMFCFHSVLGSF